MPENISIKITSSGAEKSARDIDKITSSTEELDHAIDNLTKATKEYDDSLDAATGGAQEQVAANDSMIRTLIVAAAKFIGAHIAIGLLMKTLAKSVGGWTNLRNILLAILPAAAAVEGSIGKMGTTYVRTTARMSKFWVLAKKLLPVLIALAAAYVLIKVALALVNFGKIGADALPVIAAFTALSNITGETADVLIERLSKAVQNTVPQIDLMKSSVLALNSGAIKSAADLETLAKSAFILGQTVGIDTTEAFQNLIRGIGLINPQLIKTVGVLVSADDAYREYAETIGKTVAQLDDHERKEAFRIKVMDEVVAATERVGNITNALSVAFQQAGASGTDLKQSFSQAIASSGQLEGLINDFKTLLAGLSTAAEGTGATLIRMTADWVFGMIRALSLPVTGPFILISKFAKEADEEVQKLLSHTIDIAGISSGSGIFAQATSGKGVQFAGTFDSDAAGLFDLSERAQDARDRLQELQRDLVFFREKLHGAFLRDEDSEVLNQQLAAIKDTIVDATAEVKIFDDALMLMVFGAMDRLSEIDLFPVIVDPFVESLDVIETWAETLERVMGSNAFNRMNDMLDRGIDAPGLPLGPVRRARESIQGMQRAGIAFGQLGPEGQAEAQKNVQLIIEQNRAMDVWNQMLGETGDSTSQAAQQMTTAIVTSMGTMVQSVLLASQSMTQAITTMVFGLGQAIAQATGQPVLGAVFGALGGIANALFGRNKRQEEERRQELQRVRVEELSQQAADRIAAAARKGPDNVTIQFIDPLTGASRTLEEHEYQLRRRERRDAISRISPSVRGVR